MVGDSDNFHYVNSFSTRICRWEYGSSCVYLSAILIFYEESLENMVEYK